jgi:hypothetical protein
VQKPDHGDGGNENEAVDTNQHKRETDLQQTHKALEDVKNELLKKDEFQ